MLFAVFIIAVIGGAFWAILAFQKHKNDKAAAWPQTTGRITISQVIYDQNKDKDWGTGETVKTKTYEPRIHFDFEVDGQTYTGTRVAYRNVHSPIKATVQKLCDRYPVGAAVDVFYDPANPKDAILERAKPKA